MQSVNLAFFYGNGVVGEMTLISSIDRLLATTFPIWHYKQRTSYSIIMCSVPFLGSAVLTGLNYFLVVRYDPNELVLSLCFDQIYPGLEIVVMLHRCGCVVLSVFVYIVVIALLYKKFVRDFAINTRTKALNKCQRKNVIDATLTMGLSTLNTVLFMLIPDLSLYFFLISAPTTYLVLNSLILNKVMFNFVLFLARHREFRRLFCDMVQSKRKNVIRNAGRVRGAGNEH
ncbi:hypothetical protein Q1695_007329 [Nippostrongylus brasiliensis]|nr:hypothetical protein Q1695_007329 [Nippostrongylus brasiliensis]